MAQQAFGKIHLNPPLVNLRVAMTPAVEADDLLGKPSSLWTTLAFMFHACRVSAQRRGKTLVPAGVITSSSKYNNIFSY